MSVECITFQGECSKGTAEGEGARRRGQGRNRGRGAGMLREEDTLLRMKGKKKEKISL